jgi:hypothetical protein
LLLSELGDRAGAIVSNTVPKDLHAVSSPDVLGHLEGVLSGAPG